MKTSALKQKISFIVLFLFGLMLIVWGWRIGFSGKEVYLPEKNIHLSPVYMGDMYTKLSGYGELNSKNKCVVTARNSGNVEELFLKPGSLVQSDTVIARLSNPSLEDAIKDSFALLKNEKIKRRKILLDQQKAMIDLESEMSQIALDLEILKLKLEAEKELLEAGVLPEIQFKRTRLELKKVVQKHTDFSKKLAKLQEANKEALSIQDDIIGQNQEKYLLALKRLESLNIKAGMVGTLQKLDIALGQNIKAGASIAVVGDPKDLFARIQVPQVHMHSLKAGMPVNLTSYNQSGIGKIEHIDPVVIEGSVYIDVGLEGGSHFMPMQRVDAVLHANKVPNTLYVDQNKSLLSGQKAYVFKMVEGKKAEKILVTFGRSFDGKVQVLEGLNRGDRIIISDVDIDEDIQVIHLVNS